MDGLFPSCWCPQETERCQGRGRQSWPHRHPGAGGPAPEHTGRVSLSCKAAAHLSDVHCPWFFHVQSQCPLWTQGLIKD